MTGAAAIRATRTAALESVNEWWQTLTPRAAALAAAALAAITCGSALGSQPLSWDEAVSASAASRSLSSLLRLVQHTDAPLGAYYLFLHGWTRLLAALHVNTTEMWLRLPSAVAGVLAVALTTVLAARWFDARVGLVAGALLAVHPLAVFYAHDARPYAFAMLTVVVATALLDRALVRPTAPLLAAYGAAITASLYAHLFAVLALAAHVVMVMTRGTQRWRFAIVATAVAIAASPLAFLASGETGEIGWIPRPSVAAVASFLGRLGGGPMTAPFLALAAASAYAAWHASHGHNGHDQKQALPLVALWGLVPPVVLIVVDFAHPVLVVRYALVSVPALAILGAVAARRAGGRLGTGLVVVALLAGLATSAYQQAQPYKYDDFRAASDMIVDTSHTRDGLVFIPSSMRVGYDRYRHTDRSDPIPTRVSDLALVSSDGPLVAKTIGGSEISAATIAAAINSHTRIYVIDGGDAHPNSTDAAKLAALHANFVASWTTKYGDITVSLWVRRGSL